jgi:hypothetical protein
MFQNLKMSANIHAVTMRVKAVEVKLKKMGARGQRRRKNSQQAQV